MSQAQAALHRARGELQGLVDSHHAERTALVAREQTAQDALRAVSSRVAAVAATLPPDAAAAVTAALGGGAIPVPAAPPLLGELQQALAAALADAAQARAALAHAAPREAAFPAAPVPANGPAQTS